MSTTTWPTFGLAGQADTADHRPLCPTCRHRMRGLLAGCTNPNCQTREAALDHAHVRSADQ